MKYQETLAQRELVIEDLPKSQQKKIAELEKLVSKIEEIEADVDDLRLLKAKQIKLTKKFKDLSKSLM
jgi:hypothetical protein